MELIVPGMPHHNCKVSVSKYESKLKLGVKVVLAYTKLTKERLTTGKAHGAMKFMAWIKEYSFIAWMERGLQSKKMKLRSHRHLNYGYCRALPQNMLAYARLPAIS